ncbi:ATPase [Microbacterium sp. HM58-2]|nr:ATPase [Microbacterium sp. HM58-2]
MSADNPLIDGPKVSTRGEGRYGMRFTRFVVSGAPGGYSTVELIYLFPTQDERDAYARGLHRKLRDTRQTGPIIESFEVEVAELRWFEPIYLRTTLLAEQAEHAYGVVRIYDTEPPVYDVRYAEDENALRWMLAEQWEQASPAPGEPRAPYDVYFFAPEEPVSLRLIVEQDDEAGEEECSN